MVSLPSFPSLFFSLSSLLPLPLLLLPISFLYSSHSLSFLSLSHSSLPSILFLRLTGVAEDSLVVPRPYSCHPSPTGLASGLLFHFTSILLIIEVLINKLLE